MYGDIYVQEDDFNEQEVCNRLDRDKIKLLMPERDRLIVEMLEAGDCQSDIAIKINLTRARISMIVKKMRKTYSL